MATACACGMDMGTAATGWATAVAKTTAPTFGMAWADDACCMCCCCICECIWVPEDWVPGGTLAALHAATA